MAVMASLGSKMDRRGPKGRGNETRNGTHAAPREQLLEVVGCGQSQGLAVGGQDAG